MTQTRRKPTVTYNVMLFAEDAAERGLNQRTWAKRAKVTDMVISRFLREMTQTPGTAKKMARALGQPLKRYIVNKG